MLKMDLGLDLLVLLSNVAPLDKSLLLSIMRDGEREREQGSLPAQPSNIRKENIVKYL